MVTHAKQRTQDPCSRCGGLMVQEEIREVNQVGLRCVMCGERIDPLILEHRRKMRTPEGARQLVAKGAKAGMN